MRVVIAGGHGQIALILERLLAQRGDSVAGFIRNPAHARRPRSSGRRTCGHRSRERLGRRCRDSPPRSRRGGVRGGRGPGQWSGAQGDGRPRRGDPARRRRRDRAGRPLCDDLRDGSRHRGARRGRRSGLRGVPARERRCGRQHPGAGVARLDDRSAGSSHQRSGDGAGRRSPRRPAVATSPARMSPRYCSRCSTRRAPPVRRSR